MSGGRGVPLRQQSTLCNSQYPIHKRVQISYETLNLVRDLNFVREFESRTRFESRTAFESRTTFKSPASFESRTGFASRLGPTAGVDALRVLGGRAAALRALHPRPTWLGSRPAPRRPRPTLHLQTFASKRALDARTRRASHRRCAVLGTRPRTGSQYPARSPSADGPRWPGRTGRQSQGCSARLFSPPCPAPCAPPLGSS